MPAEERAGLRRKAGKEMEDTKRLGIVGIVVSDLASADQVNEVIHDHNDIVVARMGIPYKERNVSVISLLIDGEQDAINALTGELGKIKDVSAKAMLNKMK
jgi:putative iron-only hydrogenase system regulator